MTIFPQFSSVLRRDGLRGRVASERSLLTAQNTAARLQYARQQLQLHPDDEYWRTVIFTDEKSIRLVVPWKTDRLQRRWDALPPSSRVSATGQRPRHSPLLGLDRWPRTWNDTSSGPTIQPGRLHRPPPGAVSPSARWGLMPN